MSILSTVYVSETNYDELVARVAKLERIANKLDVPAPTARVVGESMIAILNDDGFHRLDVHGNKMYRKRFEVELSGEYPVYNGFQLVARYDHEDNLCFVTGHGKEIGYKPGTHSKAFCDHCRAHRDRNKTFIVQDTESGNILQVGGNCCKYYINHKHITWVASFMNAIAMFEDEDYWMMGSSDPRRIYMELTEVVAASEVVLTVTGEYVNTAHAAMERIASNAEIVRSMLVPTSVPSHTSAMGDLFQEQRQSDFQSAKETIAYVKEQLSGLDNSDNEFLFNIESIIENGFVKFNHVGIAAYIPMLARRFKEDAREKELSKDSEYVGTLKKRQAFEVELLRVVSYETMYGWNYLNIMRDRDGNQIVWKGTKSVRDDDRQVPEPGVFFQLKATPSEHSEYNGAKQTKVQRGVFEGYITE